MLITSKANALKPVRVFPMVAPMGALFLKLSSHRYLLFLGTDYSFLSHQELVIQIVPYLPYTLFSIQVFSCQKNPCQFFLKKCSSKCSLPKRHSSTTFIQRSTSRIKISIQDRNNPSVTIVSQSFIHHFPYHL